MNKEEFLGEMLDLWNRVPQLRFGQLLYNAIEGDLFYIDNEDLLFEVDEFVKSVEINQKKNEIVELREKLEKMQEDLDRLIENQK